MLCPWQDQGEDCHLKVGTLKCMTGNTGPTDQGHSSKPVLALGMEEGNWKQGPFLSLLVKRPSLQVSKLYFCPPSPLPVQFLCFLPSQVGQSPLCPTPFPTSPGSLMTHKAEASSSGQSRYKLSSPLHVAGY